MTNTSANAEYQREWRKRNEKAIRLHRKMLTPLRRMHEFPNKYLAWDLAQLLHNCCGAENAAHLAHWLKNPKAKRPTIDDSAWREVAAALKGKPPPK